ncbi:MAG: head-tail connector protein [Sphingomonadales bacterium]
MALSLVTAPAAEPITLAEAKDHLRITGTDDDVYITRLIAAARQHVDGSDGILGRALITQTWDLFLPKFPAEIRVPLPPLQSVTSIKYIDAGGITQTLAASEYTVDVKRQPGRIVEAFGKSWPATRDVPNAVEVRFDAGYGLADSDVPEPIRHALLFFIAHLFERREPVVTGTTVAKIPDAADALLASYRIHGFG